MFINPHTSICIRSRTLLARSPFLVEGDLITFPRRQDSQVGSDTITDFKDSLLCQPVYSILVNMT